MPADSLRNLRHELRTPINHILGYAELLLEEATDLQRPDLVADIERIRAAGNVLLKPIVEHLDAAQPELTSTELVELGLELRTPLTTIVGYSDLLAEVAVGEVPAEFLADISCIRDAGMQLLSTVNATLELLETRRDSAAAVHADQSRTPAGSNPSTVELSVVSPAPMKGHLLVVDDDGANRDILSRRLMRLGCTVSCADNGRAAIERLLHGGIDLMLLDLMMPGLNGFDVLALRRENARLNDVPVIVLSALDELASAVHCITLGADDYLLKPYEPVLLQARIGACLERKQLRDREKEYVQLLADERGKSDRLLLNMLPESIAARLKEQPGIVADTFEEVSVLFADLVGFTRLSLSVSPHDMVAMLNRVFSAFDTLAERYGLEKIKTIGDGYEVVAGAPVPRSDHAQALAEMALGMQSVMRGLRAESAWPLDIRIGIDTGGPVVAGVIGRQKYVYEVWGDCVNTASRMESHGLPGCIQVTAAVYERLRETYTFIARGTIDVKSRGPMATYLLTGRP